MKKLVYLFAGGAVLAGALTEMSAQCVIEGGVALAQPKSAPALNQRYQISAGAVEQAAGPRAVVYLEGSFPAATNGAPAVARMAQRQFRFDPVLLPVRTGTTVEFPNYDAGYHNVFSYSKPKRFDLGRYRTEEKPAAVVFDQPGAIKLYCEIHDHMRATILVLDTPHFTVTDDKTGKYRLEQLPAGNYLLKAWLDEKRVLEKPVTLKAGETLRVDFSAAPAP